MTKLLFLIFTICFVGCSGVIKESSFSRETEYEYFSDGTIKSKITDAKSDVFGRIHTYYNEDGTLKEIQYWTGDSGTLDSVQFYHHGELVYMEFKASLEVDSSIINDQIFDEWLSTISDTSTYHLRK